MELPGFQGFFSCVGDSDFVPCVFEHFARYDDVRLGIIHDENAIGRLIGAAIEES